MAILACGFQSEIVVGFLCSLIFGSLAFAGARMCNARRACLWPLPALSLAALTLTTPAARSGPHVALHVGRHALKRHAHHRQRRAGSMDRSQICGAPACGPGSSLRGRARARATVGAGRPLRSEDNDDGAVSESVAWLITQTSWSLIDLAARAVIDPADGLIASHLYSTHRASARTR